MEEDYSVCDTNSRVSPDFLFMYHVRNLGELFPHVDLEIISQLLASNQGLVNPTIKELEIFFPVRRRQVFEIPFPCRGNGFISLGESSALANIRRRAYRRPIELHVTVRKNYKKPQAIAAKYNEKYNISKDYPIPGPSGFVSPDVSSIESSCNLFQRVEEIETMGNSAFKRPEKVGATNGGLVEGSGDIGPCEGASALPENYQFGSVDKKPEEDHAGLRTKAGRQLEEENAAGPSELVQKKDLEKDPSGPSEDLDRPLEKEGIFKSTEKVQKEDKNIMESTKNDLERCHNSVREEEKPAEESLPARSRETTDNIQNWPAKNEEKRPGKLASNKNLENESENDGSLQCKEKNLEEKSGPTKRKDQSELKSERQSEKQSESAKEKCRSDNRGKLEEKDSATKSTKTKVEKHESASVQIDIVEHSLKSKTVTSETVNTAAINSVKKIISATEDDDSAAASSTVEEESTGETTATEDASAKENPSETNTSGEGESSGGSPDARNLSSGPPDFGITDDHSKPT